MSIQSEINRLKQAVSDAFTAIGNKGGTVPSSKVSGNLATAINSIPSGVSVKEKSARFTTSSSGAATINCGFKPDVITIHSIISGSYEYNLTVANHKFSSSSGDTLVCYTGYDGGNLNTFIELTSTGFQIQMYAFTYDDNYDDYANNRTFSYYAIKYT